MVFACVFQYVIDLLNLPYESFDLTFMTPDQNLLQTGYRKWLTWAMEPLEKGGVQENKDGDNRIGMYKRDQKDADTGANVVRTASVRSSGRKV